MTGGGRWDSEAQVTAYREKDNVQRLISWPELSSGSLPQISSLGKWFVGCKVHEQNVSLTVRDVTRSHRCQHLCKIPCLGVFMQESFTFF